MANTQRTTIEHGITYTSWISRLGSVGPLIDQARIALQHLSVDPEYMATLRNITDDDLKVAGDLTDERRVRQQSDALPWFWQFG